MRRDLELRRFASDSLINFGRVAAVSFLGIFSSIIVARGLGPEGRGIYAVVLFFPQALMSLSDLGVGHAAVYHVAREQNEAENARIIQTIIALSIWLSIANFALGILLVQSGGSQLFPGVPTEFLYLSLLLLPFTYLRLNIRGIFRGKENFRADGLVEIVYTALNLILYGIFLWILDWGVMGAVTANIVATALAVGYALFRLRRLTAFSNPLALLVPRLTYARAIFGYGLRIYLASIAVFLLFRADVVLLNILGNGVVAVGVYTIAVTLAQFIWRVMSSVMQVIMPRIASWEGDSDRQTSLTVIVMRHTLWFSLGMAIAIAFLGESVIVLFYGEEFRASVSALITLLPGIVVFNFANVLGSDIAGRGKPGINSIQSIIALLINVVANIILIPRLDHIGAALASTIAYTYLGLTTLLIYCWMNRQKWQTLIFPTAEDMQRLQRVMGRLTRLRPVSSRPSQD